MLPRTPPRRRGSRLGQAARTIICHHASPARCAPCGAQAAHLALLQVIFGTTNAAAGEAGTQAYRIGCPPVTATRAPGT